MISGAFTMTQQAMLLGFLPRMEIRFTSRTEASQIYVPQINWLLAVAVIGLVLAFKTSELSGRGLRRRRFNDNARHHTARRRGRPLYLALEPSSHGRRHLILLHRRRDLLQREPRQDPGWRLCADLAGAAIFAAMTTWRTGRLIVFDRIARENPPYEEFWEEMHCANMPRVPGVAIYLTSRADRVPSSLKLNVRHNKCLHETVILLTVLTERIPRVPLHRRVQAEPLDHGFVQITLRYGFAESPMFPVR